MAVDRYKGVEGFIKELGATVRECIGCGCLTPGGPTRCKRCASEKRTADPMMLILSTKHSPGMGGYALWWGPNRSGYVVAIEGAGRYTQEEARGLCKAHAGDVMAVPEDEAVRMGYQVVDYSGRLKAYMDTPCEPAEEGGQTAEGICPRCGTTMMEVCLSPHEWECKQCGAEVAGA
jgi:hypothetical protein